ncbi:hypothetical protein ACQ7HM_01590 [Williamsia sp. MIQD14]|uniref:hypothetical protein n=1 Tax=Williamsia sp. MIQD14 TaxID=3425703 RepID=UPI003DA09DA0
MSAIATTRRRLAAQGHTRVAVEAALRDGRLIELAAGHLLPAADLGPFPEDRHHALARGVLRDRPSGDALARVSSAINLRLPVTGADLGRVQLARVGGTASGSKRTSVVSLHRNVSAADLTVIDGAWSTTAARTVVDLARSESVRTATITGDAALQRRLCTIEELTAVLEGLGAVDGCGRARAVLTGLDGRAESPLESWSRLVIGRSNLPTPDLQHEIRDRGRLVARVDFWWEEFGVVGECDGMGKYFGEYSSKSLREVLDEEKFRAQELVDLGYIVVRWSWNELLHRPEVVIERIDRALRSR